MPFRPGGRVGHYEIGSLLGHGGMGEVYRARDLTLHRDVAIKVITDQEVDAPSALARFEREARLLAALNHANIASIYGLLDTDGVRGIVMELVEGPTLSERLSRGALPVSDALAVAAQMADAIEAAHEKGVVHRDLKPANVKFTSAGAVKVLDFGIAKALAPEALAESQATTMEATRAGTIVGTPAYMSPEQARGLPVDTRTDVWAFGVIVYEMLAGRSAFGRATTSDVVAAVLTADPDWTALPASVPPGVVRLLRRCLERDPSRRLKHIGIARYALEEPLVPASAPRFPWPAIAAFAGGAATVALGFATISPARGAPAATAPAAILSMEEPGGEPLYLFAGPIALSPDGTRVAMVTNAADGKPRIWVRSLSATSPEPVLAAAGGINPFWSPDGKSLGFFAQGQLKVVTLASGSVRNIATWNGAIAGGAWSRDGVIVFAEPTGLKRVAADGGPVTPIAADASSRPGAIVAAPGFLPDGRHFLYFSGDPQGGQGAVMAGSLDGGAPRQVMPSASMAIYAAPGYLLYQRGGEIVAQRFNADRLSIEGDPSVLAGGAWAWTTVGMMALSASDTGTIMFATRRTSQSRLTVFERSGRPVGTIGEVGEWIHVAVSPDERSLAAERLDPRTGAGAIWSIDLARNVASRLTPEPTWSLAPVWSADGAQIIYAASRENASDLFVKPANGVGAEAGLYPSHELKTPTDWTRDGRIIFNMFGASGWDIMTLPARGHGAPAPLVSTSANEGSGKVSPDGQWLAYTSNESGRVEVYVRSLAGRGRWPVSRDGGWQPRWRRDGKELFFLNGESTLMAARVTASASDFSTAEPQALPIKVQPDVTGWRYSYDVLSLGQRFIASVPTGRDNTPPIIVIPGWTALLRK